MAAVIESIPHKFPMMYMGKCGMYDTVGLDL